MRMTKTINFSTTTNAEILRRVRELRHNPTEAEQLLWRLLRNRQLMGYKFRRQHPYCGYILDFYCHEARLVIEVDGGQHADHEQAAYDCDRTKCLESNGLRVIRFWNHEILGNIEGVLQEIVDTLNAPHPSPLPKGEGENSVEISNQEKDR